MKIIEVDKQKFDEYACSHKLNNLQQNSTWGEIEKFNGWQDNYIFFMKKDEVIGACMLLRKKFLKYTKMYAPRGLLVDYNNKKVLKECIELLKDYGKKNNAIFIKLEPYISYQELDKDGNIVKSDNNNYDLVSYLVKDLKLKHHGFSHNKFYSNSRYIAVLVIDRDIEDIEGEYTKKCKSSIKRALNSHISIHYFDKSDLKDFYDCLDNSSDFHNFYNPPLSYFEKMYDILKKNENGWFVGCKMNVLECKKDLKQNILELDKRLEKLADSGKREKFELERQKQSQERRLELLESIKQDEIILCAATFIEIGNTFYYYVSGAKREFLTYCAPYLLQREMIRFAHSRGNKIYNFLGISGIFDEKHPRYGVIHFKKEFNVDMVELVGEFDLIINKFGYLLNNFINKVKHIRNKLRKCIK